MKKVLALLMAVCAMGSMAACGTPIDDDSGSNGVENVYNVESSSKTKLQVIHFNGGIGSIWIEKAAERFAKEYKDKSYAKDKKGVYVDFTHTMTIDCNTMASASYNVYINERFSSVNALAQSGLLLPIDDIVRDETREGGSLDSKLFEQAKGSLKGNDGKYYGLPHYESFGGLSFNNETFDSSLAYFAAEEETDKVLYESSKYGSAYFVTTLDAKRSNGPDGKPDTVDDGLPCSLEELILLMDYFKQTTTYAPIIVSGDYTEHVNYFIAGLWSALAGAEQMRNYYNSEGEIEVVDYDHPDGPYTNENLFPGIDYIKKPRLKKVMLNQKNGYLGNTMAAKYYALAMVEIFEKEGFYCDDSYISTRSHYDAQMNLYLGGTGQYKRAAMLIEASYWHNESKKANCFKQYELIKQKSADDLNFTFMALPTSYYTAGAQGQDVCLLDISQTYTVINGNIANNAELREAAKDFVRFLYSDYELRAFTVETGMPRAINYDLTPEEQASLPYFYQRLWELRDNNFGSNLVMLSGTTSAFKQTWASIVIHLTSDNLSPYAKNSSAFPHFRRNSANPKGTRTIFEDLQISQSAWNAIYKEDR